MPDDLGRTSDGRTALASLTTSNREHERRLDVLERQQQALFEALQRFLPIPAQIDALQRSLDDIKEAMRLKQQQDDARGQFGANYRVSRESLEEGRLRDVRTSFWTVTGFVITIMIFVVGTIVQIALTRHP